MSPNNAQLSLNWFSQKPTEALWPAVSTAIV